MPRRFFRRVSTGYLDKDQPGYLRPFRGILSHPTFFAVNRRSIAGGVWLGVLIGLIPLPAQTVVAIVAAIIMRVNLPLAALCVWVTNPVTLFPIYYFEYQLGTLLLGMPRSPFSIELSLDWLATELVTYWRPLMLGSLITATVVASLCYLTVSLAWRGIVSYRFKRRHQFEP